tara:strand:- start:139 stop:864 length:726 start_codon:yes stop_codon:yes gene_type:complete
MKILVLGHRGMLGHMVHKYFSTKKECELVTINSRWSSEDFIREVLSFNGNYIINCIGAIHQRKTEFDVNVDLPIWLDSNCVDCRIIHPGTDFETDGDRYGVSKKEAAEYILKRGRITKIIKTSIFGPELISRSSIFEWFMNSENEVGGWTENYWNGITTLQWSKICYDMLVSWDSYEIVNIPATECISKYQLLNLIKKVFNKDIIVNKDPSMRANRCLSGTLKVKDINKQLLELKEFYYGN